MYDLGVSILNFIFSGFYMLFKNLPWLHICTIIYFVGVLVFLFGAYAMFKSIFLIISIVVAMAVISFFIRKVFHRIKAAISRKRLKNTQDRLKTKQTTDATKHSELISAITTAATSKPEFDSTTIAKLEAELNQIKFELNNEMKETQKAADLFTILFETERIKAGKQIASLEGQLIHTRAISQNSIKFDNEETIDASRVGRLKAELTDADRIKIDMAKLARREFNT